MPPLVSEQTEQLVLGADVVVLHRGGLVERSLTARRARSVNRSKVTGRRDESLLHGLARDAEVLADLGPRLARLPAPVDEVVEQRVAEVGEVAGPLRRLLELHERVGRQRLHVADEAVEGDVHACQPTVAWGPILSTLR